MHVHVHSVTENPNTDASSMAGLVNWWYRNESNISVPSWSPHLVSLCLRETYCHNLLGVLIYDLAESNPLIYHPCPLDVGTELGGEVMWAVHGARGSVTSFWRFAPACHFEESPLHIFV